MGKMVEDLEMDVPMVGKYVADFAADLVAHGHVKMELLKPGLTSVAESGAAKKIAVHMLNLSKNVVGEEAVRAMWESSGCDMKEWVHEEDRSGSNWNALLTKESLEWLYPMLGCSKYLNDALTKKEDV